MIKAVFLDFDGTVYSHQTNMIPESTIKAVELLREKGILSFLCTGRAHVELEAFDLSRLKLDGFVLSNGQAIYNDKDELIHEKGVEGELREILIRMFNEKKVPIYFATRDDLILNFCNDHVAEVQASVSSAIPEVKPYNGETFYMASIFIPREDMIENIEHIRELSEITYWHQGACDIVPEGRSKSSGVDETISLYGIDISETMAFGDGENDMDMLKHCGIGVAMGNSTPSILEAADYVTDDIDDDGLYNALKHFGLI